MPESVSLSNIVTQNLDKLARKYPFVIRADISFKLGNSKDRNNMICKAELSLPGPKIFAKSQLDNFEKATAETLNDLKRQLKKRKEKFHKYQRIN